MLEKIHVFLFVFVIVSALLYCFLHNKKVKNMSLTVEKISNEQKQILADIQKIASEKLDELDYEKKYYKGNWKKVEHWKKNIQAIVAEYQNNLSDWSEEELKEEKECIRQALNKGVEAIKKNQDPYSVSGDFLLFEIPQETNKKTTNIALYIIFGLLGAWLYLVFAGIKINVIVLTFGFSMCLFPKNIFMPDEEKKTSPYHSVAVIILSAGGFFLNQWVYEQSDTVQMWVSLLLPVVYGIIYYAIRHKRKIREI